MTARRKFEITQVANGFILECQAQRFVAENKTLVFKTFLEVLKYLKDEAERDIALIRTIRVNNDPQ